MRNITLPSTLTTLLVLFFSSFSYGQETHTITLYVNTAEVTSQNTAEQCNFGQAEGISNEDFTIQVKKGDIIVWKAVSINAPESDMVSVTAINHEGGVNIFNKNVLLGNGQSPEVVTGTVVQGAPGDEEKYKISFKVFNNGEQRNGTFHIDPKIQIH